MNGAMNDQYICLFDKLYFGQPYLFLSLLSD